MKDDAPAGHGVPRYAATLQMSSLVVRMVWYCALPALLWTIVAIAAPAFVSPDSSTSDRALQEDFAVYYFSALEMRRGVKSLHHRSYTRLRAPAASLFTGSRYPRTRPHST